MPDPTPPFSDTHAFQDDVLDRVLLNRIERDCIDTPEYRRLFRLAQLGLVDYLYPTANHTRGTHSIGVCARAKRLVDHLNENTPRVTAARQSRCLPTLPTPHISLAERSLISLAALLHDIPHGPLSHDIEKKTHRYGPHNNLKLRSHYGPYPKHDDCRRNPALYVILFDIRHSVLARVLRSYSPEFWTLLQQDAENHAQLQEFVALVADSPSDDIKQSLLPSLLFHLLLFEDIETAETPNEVKVLTSFQQTSPQRWGIGPKKDWNRFHQAWYQPYRHDIVGNTLSADLLDYLARDAKRMGMTNAFDSKLLLYYVLVTQKVRDTDRLRTRCAIDLNDYKRGRIRSERINDVFRLLDFRHQIHEKAIHHRIVQAAIAMLGRALMLADERPTLETLYAIGKYHHVLAGDDYFLCNLMTSGTTTRPRYHFLSQKLVERRLYRPLMMIPGDHADSLLDDFNVSDRPDERHDAKLRLLGAILDSQHFAPMFCLICWCVERLLDHSFASTNEIDTFVAGLLRDGDFDKIRKIVPSRVILWTTPYKQLYKDPALVVRADECVDRIDLLAEGSASSLPPTVRARLEAGMKDAESRYASMWTVYAFISDGLYYSGGLARLLPDHPCRRDTNEHVKHLAQAQDELLRAIRVAWKWWTTRDSAPELSEPISNSDLKSLLERFLAHSQSRSVEAFDEEASRQRKLCGLDLQQYIHDEPGVGCKDVRYRFDHASDVERAGLDARLSAEDVATVGAFLKAANLDTTEIGHEEVADIIFHIKHPAGLFRDSDLQAAAREGTRPSDEELRKRWWEVELATTVGETDGAAPHTEILKPAPAGEFLSRGSGRASGRRKQRRSTSARQTETLPNLDESADSTGSGGGGVPDTEAT